MERSATRMDNAVERLFATTLCAPRSLALEVVAATTQCAPATIVVEDWDVYTQQGPMPAQMETLATPTTSARADWSALEMCVLFRTLPSVRHARVLT